MKIRCEGPPGHGSRFINDNAPEKLVSYYFLDVILDWIIIYTEKNPKFSAGL